MPYPGYGEFDGRGRSYEEPLKIRLNSGRSEGADADMMATFTSICVQRRIRMASYETSSVTVYLYKAFRRAIDAADANVPVKKIATKASGAIVRSTLSCSLGLNIHFLRGWMLSFISCGIGMMRITRSVKIVIAAVEKYVAGRLLQPSGNEGSHARQGLL